MKHVPVGEVVEPGEGVHQRRLAGPRRAHDGGEVAGGELDVDAVEGPDGALALAVDLGGADGPGGDLGGGRWAAGRGVAVRVAVMAVVSCRGGWCPLTICLRSAESSGSGAVRDPPPDVHLEDDAGVRRPADARRERVRYVRPVTWVERQLERLRSLNPLIVDSVLAVVFFALGLAHGVQPGPHRRVWRSRPPSPC